VRLLLDENASGRLFVGHLRRAGHDVETTAAAVGLGADDTEIAAAARDRSRVVVTRDCADFRSIYNNLASHPGLLLVYGFEGKATAAEALVGAVNNVASIYTSMDNLVLALNSFFW
jgi:predicted nuclease of predicted toxin-antitoxin system